MAVLLRETVSSMDHENIQERLDTENKLYTEFSAFRESLLEDISSCRAELKVKEKILEKQDRRLDRLKFFIEKETEEREQLHETLKQNTRPGNVKKRLQNIAEQLGKYKEEEQIVIQENLETLQEIRDTNCLILKKLDDVNDLDSRLGSKQKNIKLLRQGLSKIHILE